MYADDLVLVSASISDLQSMVDVCINELNSLDMKINAKKSSCIRFGKGYKNDCAQVSVDGISLTWSPNLKYLGITLKSSMKFSVDLKILDLVFTNRSMPFIAKSLELTKMSFCLW